MATQPIIGVDGCPDGWVAVVLLGEHIEVRPYRTFVDVVQAWTHASVIAVDMPIGLVTRGWRQADVAGKRHLMKSGRASSVFMVPPRRVFEAETHEAACVLALKYAGGGISKQAFGLFPKILEGFGTLMTIASSRCIPRSASR